MIRVLTTYSEQGSHYLHGGEDSHYLVIRVLTNYKVIRVLTTYSDQGCH